jgi:hypothetical protein
LHCYRHPWLQGIASCHRCGRSFCTECARETHQTQLCPDCYDSHCGEVIDRYRKQSAAKQWKEEKGPAGESLLESAPDYDFSQLEGEKRREKGGWWKLRRSGKKEIFTGERGEAKAGEEGQPPVRGSYELESKEGAATTREEREDIDAILEDVITSLVDVSTVGEVIPEQLGKEEEIQRLREELKREKEKKRRRFDERWGFLSQPRVNEETSIAPTKPKAVFFVLFMLLLGAFSWAVPNAFLIPKDREYAIHALAIGIVLTLLFWWKAGKAHSTKLAIQASLTTLFALVIGEFAHWALVVVKTPGLRKVINLISFQFIWENGGEILSSVAKAMFPLSFLLVLLLPTLVAFIIGFGAPPIPEFFFLLARAIKGEREAGEERA